jgi:D-serine deaminase-like pyridoxal phosphate-dependent protein
VGIEDRGERERLTELSMQPLLAAAEAVAADEGVVSAGGTGTFDVNRWASEIQAGSYALMDTAYDRLGLPFELALTVLATVISVGEGWAVADAGLKALAMDHGNPEVEGATAWFYSDEHVTFGGRTVRVGDRVRILPAHVDPTVAKHQRLHLVRGDEVLDVWDVDLRGW